MRNISINRFEHYSAKKRGGTQTTLALGELEDCLSDGETVVKSFDTKMITDCINNLLKNQPKQNRILFVRRYWYLYSIKEIADEFSMTESKVTSILHRMRKKLKEELEKEGVNL